MKKKSVFFIIALSLCSNLFAQTTNPFPNFGIGSLPVIGDEIETRSISPENPTGEKGKGGMAIPNRNDSTLPFSISAEQLGQGWKVNPFVKVKPGETSVVMDVNGPGMIQHMWMVVSEIAHSRAYILRFYWDDEKDPSVEVPISDFFAVGHEIFSPINSVVVSDNVRNALNCYWPMPFRKHVKITLTNEGDKNIDLFTYQITYAKMEIPKNIGYFHAQWRRATVDPAKPEYVILDNIKGKGKYVGTFLSWTALHSGWFGEGEVKFFMDGDGKFPTFNGTGTEDYFLSSFGFPESFSSLYVGAKQLNKGTSDESGPKKWGLYRWHIMDPIYFKKDLRVTIQSLGWYEGKPNGYRPLDDDIASVGYWYQEEPHVKFPKIPELKDRWPR